eukprot:3067759-Karenia_brevis.AAC.1
MPEQKEADHCWPAHSLQVLLLAISVVGGIINAKMNLIPLKAGQPHTSDYYYCCCCCCCGGTFLFSIPNQG